MNRIREKESLIGQALVKFFAPRILGSSKRSEMVCAAKMLEMQSLGVNLRWPMTAEVF